MNVIDFFCGAGGFSEGFRQQGFNIIQGIDFWQPAIETHNLNHHLNDSVKNVLDFWSEDTFNTEKIDNLPDSEVIIGSPSCVSFSMSNKAGKADKSEGIRLIESVLRAIAVKKHQNGSILECWYLENVPQSRPHIKDEYTFCDLNLTDWALTRGIPPLDIALTTTGETLNAADYGAPQSRNRLIIGEWVLTNEFVCPVISHHTHVSSGEIRRAMPPVTLEKGSQHKWVDPNYPVLSVHSDAITDHFYDSGLYKIEWEKAEHLKVNHPYMGKMSFPENEKRACRTVMATKSASTREAIIYKSEIDRVGNGEYRLPTIREIASLMGYPYCYQFTGSESAKWKQVGNSVSPHLSSALAKAIRSRMGLEEIGEVDFSQLNELYRSINNLNTYKEKIFDSPQNRSKRPKFRRHPIKAGNMTVDLMNYHPDSVELPGESWFVTAHFGTGKNHKAKIINRHDIENLEFIIQENVSSFKQFKSSLDALKTDKKTLQKSFENDLNLECSTNPILLVKQIARIITNFEKEDKFVSSNGLLPKPKIPLSQVLSAYALLNLIN